MADVLIGLMSGTSMDCVDAVLVRFDGDIPELLGTHAEPMPTPLHAELLALIRPGDNELDRMARLDAAVARLFAMAARHLLDHAGMAPGAVRAIGSHGQTVRHSPSGPEPYTVQIGNPSLIAELTGIRTVADFRRRDMAAGGQGAPLAPAFHNAFLRRPGEARAVVNIGGIANITLLPADPDAAVSGFDTGPGNALLDAWAERHLGVPMDTDGHWGSGGHPIPALLDHCLNDRYFALPPPKSTGREHFSLNWLEERLASWAGVTSPQDVQATLIELTAHSITEAIQGHGRGIQRVLVCGGGVHNRTLMERLRGLLGGIPVESTAAHGVDPDYLEAIGFAWLARRTLNGEPGNVPHVTGAKGPRILGGIYPA